MGDKSLSIEQRIQRFSNTNLLDNWYYPAAVNQKGQTEYSGGGYTIDRWRSDDGLLVRDGYIEFPVGTNLYQTFEPEFTKLLLGKQLTLSVLYQDGDLEWATLTAPSAFPDNDFSVVSVSTPHATFLGMMFFPNRTAQLFRISGINLRIVAAKLELGPFQTLAHKEGDKWVLNDPPPNYASELLKCKRYQRVFNYVASGYAAAFYGYTTSTTSANAFLPVDVPLRTNPAISDTDGSNWACNVGGQMVIPDSIAPWYASKNAIGIRLNGNFQMGKGHALVLTANSEKNVIFDANL